MTKELLAALGIMGVCVVIHVTGIAFLGEQLIRQREKIEERIGFGWATLLLIAIFSVVILLHVGEAAIWAGFYARAALFKDFETSFYFSLKSYSTVGYGDVLLPPNWRLLGTLEAVSGVLLCGLSAAFLFAIVDALFRFRVKRLRRQLHKTQS